MHGSAPVKVELKWPTPPRWSVYAVPPIIVALSFVNPALACIAMLSLCVWGLTSVAITTRGGGFRPMRYAELLDLAALNEIEVWEHNDAIARARQ